MPKNKILRPRTLSDIDHRVERVLRGLGDPEPPLQLSQVRELLKLDRSFYTSNDPTLLQETISRIRIAGIQVFKRPTLLAEAVLKFDLRSLYLPDQRRILLDKSQPELKHRWNEAHEIGHSLLPWHADAMLGDNKYTLVPTCHEQVETEANFAAGRLIFLRNRFSTQANDHDPSIESVKTLKPQFGNTYTTTFWRCIETWGMERPIVGLITGHPHAAKRPADFDPAKPCRHFIQSRAFAERFARINERELYEIIAGNCTASRGGPLGCCDAILTDDNGVDQVFYFEMFSFDHSVLTLGVYQHPHAIKVVAP